jgi:hypothetical protein
VRKHHDGYFRLQAPSSLASPNLHVLTCSLLQQEISRGPAADENEYYVERYMLEPKKRNAHRNTARPEITHLRHSEMCRRGLSRCAVKYGCRPLQCLPQQSRNRKEFLYDPGVEYSPPHFQFKGSIVQQSDEEGKLFLTYGNHANQHTATDVFWSKYVLHHNDPETHDCPDPDGASVRMLRFRSCVLPRYTANSAERVQAGRRSQAASTCVELDELNWWVSLLTKLQSNLPSVSASL